MQLWSYFLREEQVQRNLYDYEKQGKVNNEIAEYTALQFLLTVSLPGLFL